MKRKKSIIDMPFGIPNAAQMTEQENKGNFLNVPNMDFAFQHGSFLLTSRSGDGKSILSRKMYYDLIEAQKIPLALINYEKMNFSVNCFLNEMMDQPAPKLRQDLKKIWEAVLISRVAGIFLKAMREESSNMEKYLKVSNINLDSLIKKFAIETGTTGNTESTSKLYNKFIEQYCKKSCETGPLIKFNTEGLIKCFNKIGLLAYLFLDELDNGYYDSFRFWNINLASLYEAIMTLRARFPQIHIIAAISRDIYDYIQNNYPNWTSHAASDNVKEIVWNKETLRLFFEKKIKNIPGSALLFKNSKTLTEKFLGIDVINNQFVKQQEEIFSYILRHTFYRAKDLVYMGNDISNEHKKLAIKMSDGITLSDKTAAIRRGVSNTAQKIGQELIVKSDSIIRDLLSRPKPEYSPTKHLLILLGKNIITRTELYNVYEKLKNEDNGLAGIHPYCILARLGIIGWVESGISKQIQRFNFETAPNAPKVNKLPKSDFYIINPVLNHITELHVSLEINDKIIIGHGYAFNPELINKKTVKPIPKLTPPFQLDRNTPQLLDKNRRSICINDFEHAILKELLSIKGLECLTMELIARIKNKITGLDEIEVDEERKIAHQVVRNLRCKLKKSGIEDKNAIIRWSRLLCGYRKGDQWHPERQVVNTEVNLTSIYTDLNELPDNVRRFA